MCSGSSTIVPEAARRESTRLLLDAREGGQMEMPAHNREALDPTSPALDVGTSPTVRGGGEQTGLSRGAIGLTGVTMQAITTTAPAIAPFFFPSVLVGFVAVTPTLCNVSRYIIVLITVTCPVKP